MIRAAICRINKHTLLISSKISYVRRAFSGALCTDDGGPRFPVDGNSPLSSSSTQPKAPIRAPWLYRTGRWRPQVRASAARMSLPVREGGQAESGTMPIIPGEYAHAPENKILRKNWAQFPPTFPDHSAKSEPRRPGRHFLTGRRFTRRGGGLRGLALVPHQPTAGSRFPWGTGLNLPLSR